MNGYVNERVGGWMSEWTDGRADRSTFPSDANTEIGFNSID